ncbi:MAG: phosphate/phosphite/phosphonate ABC transporter substrate-binding protein [Gammaproteobacteria bacterium]|nr:phosphate/phosphite/phosphonate ABC transporter substrate-binding protein [Gammaproteobacteria bacterium]
MKLPLYLKPGILIFAMSLFSENAMPSQQPELSLGIVPQQAASKLARLWTPIIIYIQDETGVRLRFKTAKDIPTFEQRLLAGEYDLAYMNPYHYTVFSQKPGYRAFAKEGEKRLKGIIVTRKDSTLHQLQGLEGMTLSFPSPAAFAASAVPRAFLREEGIDITPKYVSSHDSVYRTVAAGIYPAGGGVLRTFNNVDKNIKGQLRILYTTDGYTPHALAVHPRVVSRQVALIRDCLIAMHTDTEGKALLKGINFSSVVEAEHEDWDDVRALNITLLDHLLEANAIR